MRSPVCTVAAWAIPAVRVSSGAQTRPPFRNRHGTSKPPTDSAGTDTPVGTDRVHPVREQLRHRGPVGRRRRATVHAAARRPREPRLERLRLPEGRTSEPLPEQPRPRAVAAAPAPGRQLRGDRLGHRDPRGGRALRRDSRPVRRRVDLLLRRGRPGESPARLLRPFHPAHAGLGLPVQRARAGEDGRDVGGRPDGRRPLPRRSIRSSSSWRSTWQ